MRDPIENVTRLQKQLNNLQLENQVLKNSRIVISK